MNRGNIIFEITNIFIVIFTGISLLFVSRTVGSILILASLGYQFYSMRKYFEKNSPKKEWPFLFLAIFTGIATFFTSYKEITAYLAFSSAIRYALSLYLFTEKEEELIKLAPLQELINSQSESIKKLSCSISEEEVLRKIETTKKMLLEEEKKKIKILTYEYERKMNEKTSAAKNLEEEYEVQIRFLRKEIAAASFKYEEELRLKNAELRQVEKLIEDQKRTIKEQEALIKNLHQQQDKFIAAQELASCDKMNTIIFDDDIYKALKEAISRTKKELDIMSPWVSESVITNEIRGMIRNLVNRGAVIKIIYGIKKDDSRLENTERTIQSIRQYCGKNAVNVKAKYLVSHSKLIICDDEYYIITSCNPLSHKGNQWREIGEKSTNVENLKRYRDKYFQF